ncbi:metallophosphoesterase [Selenomonas sp. KH1T6]|uniref:metallophosphoesterase n=1 Tax=Selenomonas sp. KH1T6 TaxID=3158784 RepID=UPI0008A7D77B|nr:Calcineurin-like phosphoesterase superfamily protein [Selenomonas ruminantium]
MIYLVSDTHFYHKNIIEYCHRPFRNIEEMNQTLISNWNNAVSPEDKVYHLGDFAMAHFIEGQWESYKQAYIRTCQELLAKLNGHKILILGNHDAKARVSRECGWESVERQVVLNGFLLTHRPCEPTGYVANIHGHVHDKLPFYRLEKKGCYFNISVDKTEFRPVSFAYIQEVIAVKETEPCLLE